MSMVTDISTTLKTALSQNKHPKCIKMSAQSMAHLSESLRRNDEERRVFEIQAVRGQPMVYNPFFKKMEPIKPKEWHIEDPIRGIACTVPLEVSGLMPDGVFRIEFDEEPFVRIAKKTEEEKIAESFGVDPNQVKIG